MTQMIQMGEEVVDRRMVIQMTPTTSAALLRAHSVVQSA